MARGGFYCSDAFGLSGSAFCRSGPAKNRSNEISSTRWAGSPPLTLCRQGIVLSVCSLYNADMPPQKIHRREKMKKLITLLLALAIDLSLAACGE